MTVTALDFTMPTGSKDHEQATLALFLAFTESDRVLEHIDLLEPEDFADGVHQEVFRAIKTVHDSHDFPTVPNVGEHLHTIGKLEAVGGVQKLMRIWEQADTSYAVNKRVGRLKNQSMKRDIARKALALANKAQRRDSTVEDLMDDLAAFSAATVAQNKYSHEMSEAVAKMVDGVERRSRGEDMALGTGIMAIDRKVCMMDGDLVILAGESSSGKTGLAMDIAANVASTGKRVAVFSVEMSAESIAMRMVSRHAGLSLFRLRSERLSDHEVFRLKSAAASIESYNVMIDDNGSASLNYVQKVARRMHAKEPLQAVMVDYIQLMRPTDAKLNRERQVGEISTGLKALAKELGCPVIALSQLNRAHASRTDRRPVKSDLRDSGQLDQDADVILMVYREAQHNDKADKTKALVRVQKQRNGEICDVEVAFTGKYAHFSDSKTGGF